MSHGSTVSGRDAVGVRRTGFRRFDDGLGGVVPGREQVGDGRGVVVSRWVDSEVADALADVEKTTYCG